MRPDADVRNAVSEESLKLDALQPGLRIMDWTDEPATEVQLSFEDPPQREQASAENGVREITKRQAHFLQHAVEEAERAVQGATKDEIEKLQYILGAAMGKRQDFWMDTCCDPPQMGDCSIQVLDLFMRYGCRFLVPSGKQVQEILNALDLLMPLWDLQQPGLFYEIMELNFPELDRLIL